MCVRYRRSSARPAAILWMISALLAVGCTDRDDDLPIRTDYAYITTDLLYITIRGENDVAAPMLEHWFDGEAERITRATGCHNYVVESVNYTGTPSLSPDTTMEPSLMWGNRPTLMALIRCRRAPVAG